MEHDHKIRLDWVPSGYREGMPHKQEGSKPGGVAALYSPNRMVGREFRDKVKRPRYK
jgi:hypothetical protein